MESSFPKLPRFGISFIDPTPFKSESNGYIAIYIYIIIQPRASFDPSSIFTASYLKKHGILPKNRVLIPKNHQKP
jgi:hypothetical protein